MKKITFYDAEGRITGVMSGPLASIQATIEYLKEPFVEARGVWMRIMCAAER